MKKPVKKKAARRKRETPAQKGSRVGAYALIAAMNYIDTQGVKTKYERAQLMRAVAWLALGQAADLDPMPGSKFPVLSETRLLQSVAENSLGLR